MQFPSGLDVVLSALERIKETSERMPRASRVCMEQLLTPSESAEHSKVEEFPHPTPAAPTSPRGRGEGSDVSGRRVETRLRADDASPSKTDKSERLNAINARVSVCVKCPHLASSRTQTVFGVGNPDAEVMFVGEAPGADEDRQGEPFVGRAGQLLTKIIETMGFARGDVYIANILKCRPDMPPGSSGNRPPTLPEMETCRPYLIEQIEIIRPQMMVALGSTAVEGLLGMRSSMRELRGRWHDYNGTPLMITYHPAYLLRNQSLSEKRKVWEDMLQILERLEKPITEKQRNYFL